MAWSEGGIKSQSIQPSIFHMHEKCKHFFRPPMLFHINKWMLVIYDQFANFTFYWEKGFVMKLYNFFYFLAIALIFNTIFTSDRIFLEYLRLISPLEGI